MSHSGWAEREGREIRDYEWTGAEIQSSCAALAASITATLQGIPDKVWTSRTRKNVRPSGQDTCDQLTLGLISCAKNTRVPVLSQCTWHLLNLTKLILVYMQKLGGFAEPLVSTSIQLTKNLRSRIHMDTFRAKAGSQESDPGQEARPSSSTRTHLHRTSFQRTSQGSGQRVLSCPGGSTDQWRAEGVQRQVAP